jgi:hypothetical protein
MPGKRVQFDQETWNALGLLARDSMRDFQELADEAFADLLQKHGRPFDLKTALRQSVGAIDAAAAELRCRDLSNFGRRHSAQWHVSLRPLTNGIILAKNTGTARQARARGLLLAGLSPRANTTNPGPPDGRGGHFMSRGAPSSYCRRRSASVVVEG